MKPAQFLAIATWLIENKKCQEGFRSSISRAYYSAFHTALAFLEQMDIYIPRTANKHERVPDILDHTDDPDMKAAAAKLSQLRDHRNQADYDLSHTDPESESFALLRSGEATQIIGALTSCLKTKGVGGGKFEKVRQRARNRAKFLFDGVTSS